MQQICRTRALGRAAAPPQGGMLAPVHCHRTVRPFQPIRQLQAPALNRSSQRSPVALRAAEVPAGAAVADTEPVDIVPAAGAEIVQPSQPAGPRGAVAHMRFQRGSVQKVRRVLNVLRGRSYEEALILCEYMPYRACEKIIKCLMSAAANAKHNQGALKTKLFVSECFADQGPYLKRFRCRAQGRGYPIWKPMFHLTIRVQETA